MYKCHLGWVIFSQSSGIDFGGLSLVVYLKMAFDLGLDPYLTLSCRSKANWFGESEIGNESSGQQVSLAWQVLQVETFSVLFLGHLQGSFRGQRGNLKTSHVVRVWGHHNRCLLGAVFPAGWETFKEVHLEDNLFIYSWTFVWHSLWSDLLRSCPKWLQLCP